MDEKIREIWKDIPGYEGLYQVSPLGRIRSLDRWVDNGFRKMFLKGKILDPCKNSRGYLRVFMYKNGVKDCQFIHRIVAGAFIPNPHGNPQVNHINEIKTDNRVTNLDWVTPAENMNWGSRKGEKRKPILQFDLHGKFIKRWGSATSASDGLKINRKNISSCCIGRRKKAGNFIWRFDGQYRPLNQSDL